MGQLQADALDSLFNTNEPELRSRSRKGGGRLSRNWSASMTTDSVNAVLARRLWYAFVELLPRASNQVRDAPFIVKLQAFFKLSFEQFESDDASFDDMSADADAAATDTPSAATPTASTPAASAALPPGRGLFGRSGTSGGSEMAASEGSTTSVRAELARRAAAAVGAMGTVAVAFGAAFSGGRGLVVDRGMQPTVANIARLVFISPVHPNSMFKVLWDFLYVPINLWICVVTPVLVVFVANLRLYRPLGRVEFALDVLCLLDVLTYLRTAVIAENFRVKTSHRRIAVSYFRRWGLLDLLACVPFLTLINVGSADDTSHWALLFRLFRLTKFLRVPHILHSNNVHKYLVAKAVRSKALVGMLLLLCLVLITMHHAACYFYFIGVVATHNTMVADPPRINPVTGEWEPTSWVEPEDMVSKGYYARYMVSLYWAMYTFLTVGYGDISIVNVAEKIWAIVTAVTGVVMAGWFMGAVAAYMGATDGTEAELQQQRQDVFQFINKRRLRGLVASRVQRYQDAVTWRQLSDKDREVINGLPPMLRTEVVLHLYDKLIQKSPFLQTRPPQFVVDLLLRLRLRLYDTNEYVVREGEIGTYTYFLAAGKLQVRRETGEEGEEGGAFDPLAASPARRRPGSRLKRIGIKVLATASRSITTAFTRTSVTTAAAATTATTATAATASGNGAGGAGGGSGRRGPASPAFPRGAGGLRLASAIPFGSQRHQQDQQPAQQQQHHHHLGQQGGDDAAPTGLARAPSAPVAASRSAAVLDGAGAAGAAGAPRPLRPATPVLPPTPTSPALALVSSPGASGAGAGGGQYQPGPGQVAGAGGKLGAERTADDDVLSRIISGAMQPECGSRRREPPRGSLQVANYRDVAVVEAGGFFGYVSSRLEEERRNSVVALEWSEVLVLAAEDRTQLVQDYPDIFDDPELQPDLARRHSLCLCDPPPGPKAALLRPLPLHPGASDRPVGSRSPLGQLSLWGSLPAEQLPGAGVVQQQQAMDAAAAAGATAAGTTASGMLQAPLWRVSEHPTTISTENNEDLDRDAAPVDAALAHSHDRSDSSSQSPGVAGERNAPDQPGQEPGQQQGQQGQQQTRVEGSGGESGLGDGLRASFSRGEGEAQRVGGLGSFAQGGPADQAAAHADHTAVAATAVQGHAVSGVGGGSGEGSGGDVAGAATSQATRYSAAGAAPSEKPGCQAAD